jgi:solute:Na+ symporter, SSS family
MHLSIEDWIIILLYFVVTLAIGLSFTRKSGTSLESYILGGRNLPWWVAGFSMVATTFAADTPLAVTELVATQGISGNWMWWNMLAGGMMTVFFFASFWRRAGVLTEPELITLRYSGKPARFLRVFRSLYLGLFLNVLIIGWVNLAFMSILQVFFEFKVEEQLFWTAVVMLITALYTSLSGLLGVAYTDLMQFIVAMTGCVVLAFFVLNTPEIGGLSGLSTHLPSGTLDFFPHISDLPGAGGMLTLTLGSFFSFAAIQWWASWYPGAEPGGGGYIAQRMMSTKDEKGALLSVLLFQVAHYCLRPWPWILVALATLVLYPDLPPEESRLGFVMAMRDYLPDGFRGLMLAAFLGAYMSTLSTQLNWGAGYIVNDALRNALEGKNPEKSAPRFVWASRITVFVLMALSLIITLFIQSITEVWAFLLQCGAGLGLVLILRWFWWRINVWSEITATIAPFLAWPLGSWLGIQESYEQYLFTVSFTTLAWVSCTFLTKPEPMEHLAKFYNKVRPEGVWKPVLQFQQGTGLNVFPWMKLLAWISSVVFTFSILFLSGYALLGRYDQLGIWFVTGLISLGLLIYAFPFVLPSKSIGLEANQGAQG